MLVVDDRGLYCADGGFHVDPWAGPVERAVLTHAHADHAQPVMAHALVAASGERLARLRLNDDDGDDALVTAAAAAADASARPTIETLTFGARVQLGGVTVSLHPSGHILGAAQVRIERGGEVWVVSGDYKRAADPTTTPFEPVACDVFVTEATFALPLFRWQPPEELFADMSAWWRASRDAGRGCLVYAYALGKAARVLTGLAAEGLHGPVYTHGAVERMLAAYRASGVALPATTHLAALEGKRLPEGALVLAPPRAQNTPWAKKLDRQDVATAFCSGWMRIRGMRRRKGVERGFVLSDHADWPALLRTVEESGARRVLVTHGYVSELVHALRERGIDAAPLATPYVGEHAAEGDAGDGEAGGVVERGGDDGEGAP